MMFVRCSMQAKINNLFSSQVPNGTPKRVGSSSWRCLWTWTQTVTRSSTPISHAPLTQRTSASSSQPSKTPSCSSTSKNTTWCEEWNRREGERVREREWERNLQPHTHTMQSLETHTSAWNTALSSTTTYFIRPKPSMICPCCPLCSWLLDCPFLKRMAYRCVVPIIPPLVEKHSNTLPAFDTPRPPVILYRGSSRSSCWPGLGSHFFFIYTTLSPVLVCLRWVEGLLLVSFYGQRALSPSSYLTHACDTLQHEGTRPGPGLCSSAKGN